ncbi:hypothetical protein BDP27DRAFT_1370556 [Rhodocollybia butyracea]|uniref:Uncharacterized protein n=1 Tax=Rhodocollybia butyracea TaxID=206335 RepID=A0A9P5U0E3_9AGAR|nr:hypothetical protein BDP27DRAFT_1370556 [Rhodocollybia butyracea]
MGGGDSAVGHGAREPQDTRVKKWTHLCESALAWAKSEMAMDIEKRRGAMIWRENQERVEGLAEDNWQCGWYGCLRMRGEGVNIERVDGVVVDGTAEMFARPEPDAYCRGMDIEAGNDMGRARAKARKRSTAMAGIVALRHALRQTPDSSHTA